MTPHQSAQPLLGIALKVASTLVFTAMATLIKLAGGRYPVGEIVFFRAFFALIPVFIWVGWRDRSILPEPLVTYTPRTVGLAPSEGTGGLTKVSVTKNDVAPTAFTWSIRIPSAVIPTWPAERSELTRVGRPLVICSSLTTSQ